MMTRLELSVNQVSGIISTVSLWPLEVIENKQALQQHQELPKTMFGEQLSKLQIAEASPYGKAPGPKPPRPRHLRSTAKTLFWFPWRTRNMQSKPGRKPVLTPNRISSTERATCLISGVNNGRESAVLRRMLIPFCPHLKLSCSP